MTFITKFQWIQWDFTNWEVPMFLEGFCRGHVSAEKGSLVHTASSYASDDESSPISEHGPKAQRARLKTKPV